MDIKEGPPEQPNLFEVIDVDESGDLTKEESAAWYELFKEMLKDGYFMIQHIYHKHTPHRIK